MRLLLTAIAVILLASPLAVVSAAVSPNDESQPPQQTEGSVSSGQDPAPPVVTAPPGRQTAPVTTQTSGNRAEEKVGVAAQSTSAATAAATPAATPESSYPNNYLEQFYQRFRYPQNAYGNGAYSQLYGQNQSPNSWQYPGLGQQPLQQPQGLNYYQPTNYPQAAAMNTPLNSAANYPMTAGINAPMNFQSFASNANYGPSYAANTAANYAPNSAASNGMNNGGNYYGANYAANNYGANYGANYATPSSYGGADSRSPGHVSLSRNDALDGTQIGTFQFGDPSSLFDQPLPSSSPSPFPSSQGSQSSSDALSAMYSLGFSAAAAGFNNLLVGLGQGMANMGQRIATSAPAALPTQNAANI